MWQRVSGVQKMGHVQGFGFRVWFWQWCHRQSFVPEAMSAQNLAEKQLLHAEAQLQAC